MPDQFYLNYQDYAYREHSRKGRKFSKKVRSMILEEPRNIYGITKCMVPDCPVWHSLEAHHIKPVWAGGKGDQENGIALCPNHHFWADKGILTPYELMQYKKGKLVESPILQNKKDVVRFLNDNSQSSSVIKTPQEEYFDFIKRLRLLSICLNIMLDDQLQIKVLKEIIDAQLGLAGGMTSWEQANLISYNRSNRYQINILASSASNIAKKIGDYFSILHANHVHTVNANALGIYDVSIDYCKKECMLYPEIKDLDLGYAAYITRDMSTIFAKRNYRTKAKELIIDSKKYSENERETWMREAQNYIIWGNMERAERLIEQYTCLNDNIHENLSPIQKTIGYRIKSIYHFLTGNEIEGIESLFKAKSIATESGLGHNIGKLNQLYHYFLSADFKSFKKNYGLTKLRKGDCPEEILHML